MARHDELSDIDFWPITGIHLEMLDAIARAFAVMRADTSIADLLPASFDVVYLNHSDLRDVAIATRAVAEELVADMVAANAGSRSARTDSEALSELMQLMAGERVRLNAARRDVALDDAAPLFREIGLERHDLECHVQLAPDGGDVFVSTPIPRPTAYVSLLQRLFERAELFVLGDEFSAAERDASAWYFARWNAIAAANSPMDREAAEFASSWREQEWSLVTRDTILDEDTVLVSLMNEPEFADVPPRQQQLANALQRSVVDAFEITAIDGSLMSARSCRDATEYRVHEHNPEATPLTGMVLLGRLIPFEDELWLRSPGAVMMLPADQSQIAAVGEALADAAERMPTPIAVEALIANAVYGATVPVEIKPVSSAKAARELFDEMVADLVELDLVVRTPAIDAPPELARLATSPDHEVVRFAVDDVMGEWLSALAAQAAEVDERASRRAAKKKLRKGKKSKRRR